VGTRTLDHASIVVSLAVANVADLSMVTANFNNVPFQTWLDPIAAALMLVTYFVARRWYVPSTETEETQFDGVGCSLGLFRTYHSDLEHASLRTSGNVTLTLIWILAIPTALSNLTDVASLVWVVGVSSGTLLLIGGVVLDNMALVDNAIMRTGSADCGLCSCASQTMGCAMNTHALWHVIAILGAVVGIGAREYGISTLK